MNPEILKEELGHGIGHDSLLVGSQNGDIRELINNHKYAVISMFCSWQARNVIHRYGLLGLVRALQGCVHSLLLNGQFGDGIGTT